MGTSISPPRRTFPARAKTFVPLLCAVPRLEKAGRAVAKNPRDQGVGLDVVDRGGQAPESALGGIRGADSRRAAFAFQRRQQRGLLAADERPGPFLDAEIEAKIAAENALAQQSAGPALSNRLLDPLDRQGILRANIKNSLVGADGAGGDGHSLDDAIGKGLQQHAVHEGAGIAFVAVADEVFLPAGGAANGGPLQSRGKAGPAPPAQAAARAPPR